MLRVTCLVAGLVLMSSVSTGFVEGEGRLVVDAGVPIEVFTYRPASFVDGPLFVVCHGVQRNAAEYRDWAIPLAERFGAIVAAPHFDRERFPYEDYQQGGIWRDGAVRPRDEWTFTIFERLVAELRAATGDPAREFFVIGHSAGGQFVARLAGLAGPVGATRLIAANPGSHLFPTRDAPYGYGFGGLPEELGGDEALRRYLAVPLTLYLGTADDDPQHRSLDRSAPALAQGPHRLARGLACYDAARSLAAERGWDFNWRLVTTPGIEHDAAQMFAAAEVAEAIWGEAGLRR
jgi:poly(3-hydroxybutyrate) depolymerase